MTNPRRALHDYLARTTPKEGVIKKYAHAVTVAACGLIVPSIWAFFLRRQGLHEDEREWVWGAETLWKAHSGIIVLTCILWLFERPKRIEYLPVEPPREKEEDEK